MTSAVKDELARVELNKTCCRKAEVSALLRFAGGLHLVAGQIVVEAELDAVIVFKLSAISSQSVTMLSFTHALATLNSSWNSG